MSRTILAMNNLMECHNRKKRTQTLHGHILKTTRNAFLIVLSERVCQWHCVHDDNTTEQ